ncbi:intermembrane transport protein PqiB [Sulfitobacter donghicola]|uniref:Paraquat-inducible protein B n=1 Tax=Sulfitobacter donghicola DSW-25 = KCTC 12864 = JCM 14565 TaxID=1300350 RepID=A0A073IMM2_9RHOB|nr:MlaD family protein [Sulfitobacter donghicola]KEJ90840.1 paraquat-inducible protein B [Sulfitobacter donghicola DSW-25 = KCTC 12864 = JCM 14565]KIN68117.1 Paraquat-inducible protein B [Sulfitobacter donghicola DSW-25 = KCTC 12864 = JCM 14565]
MSDMPPPVSIKPTSQSTLRGASLVWIIPIAALIVAIAVAWQSFAARGPVIIVSFADGAGIAAGETKLKYRDIDVGEVEDVGFSEDLGLVEAHIRLKKNIAPYVDVNSVFWIVQPEVTARGISGLSTVLSGVYIEGSWDSEIGAFADTFRGSDEAPLIKPGQSGLQIAFKTTTNSSLTDNAPILFRGIEVGQIGRAQIARSGAFAITEGLIFEEHRHLVNSSTRFWETAGFDVSIGPSGAEIDFTSIATLIGGGITFDTFVSGGDAVRDGEVFDVYTERDEAHNSLFTTSDVEPLRLSVIFEENVSGLTVGAPVELSGLRIGSVDSLSGIVDFNQFGDSRVRLNVILSIQPARLGLPGEVSANSALSLLQDRVTNGLRARLATTSLLTGGLKVELIEVEDPPFGQLTISGFDLPIMPTTKSETSDASATVEGVFNRLNSLPIEELLSSAINVMNSADALISNQDLQQTPSDVRALLNDLSGIVGSDDVKNIPVSLNATLVRVESLVAELEKQRIVASLGETLEAASAAAETVTSSAAGVPELIEDIQAVASKAAALEFDTLINELTSLTTSAEALVSSPDTAQLPVALKGALDQLNATLKELREGGAVENVNKTLASAQTAADSIAISARDLPKVIERLNALFVQAGQTIEGYNKGDQLSRAAEAALRDIQQAAGALEKLARTIERNPNSLLLGR